jgi:RNA polymerase sigma-70 factor (ECF subfamily)
MNRVVEMERQVAAPETPLADDEFEAQMLEAMPRLRAFARKLSGNQETAADLVQDTMASAWAARTRFRRGSNFRAWACTILRNKFYTEVRRNRRFGDYDELSAERSLSVQARQDENMLLSDVIGALEMIPAPQREALVLIGAGGITYEEAAEVVGVPLGTIKSRINRARISLEAIMEANAWPLPRRPAKKGLQAAASLFDYFDKLTKGRQFAPAQ